MVWSRIQGFRNSTATADYLDWKAQSKAFQSLNAWSGRSVNLATGERPEQVQASTTTPGWSTTIGFTMLLGRDFTAEEGTPGKDQVVILSHQLWKERFGADRDIIGRPIRLDGKPYTVVGVIAPGPADRVQNKLYLPLAFTPEQINHDFHYLLVLGRLKRGVTLAQANADMDSVTKHIAEANPSVEQGLERERRAAAEQLPEQGDDPRALAAAGSGRLRAADRVRQRGQPAARARHRAPTGDRGASLARRGAGTGVPPVADREPRACVHRRRDRRRARVGVVAGHRGRDAAISRSHPRQTSA